MNTINFETITPQSIATIAIRGENDQKRIDHVCTLAFAGKQFIADSDSILHGAAVILGKKADEHRKANKKLAVKDRARFNAINILSTMISRWLKKQERFSGRRVSIRTQGKQGVSVALVERKDNNHKAKPKAKGAKDSNIKGVKDLASLLAYAVDNYGLETVQTAAAKLA